MIEEVIKSILKVEKGTSHFVQILVVDDGSNYNEKFEFYQILKNKYNIQVFVSPENFGYSHTVNIGLKMAQRFGFDTVITLNSDCEMSTPFLNRLEGLFSVFPRLAIVGAKLYFPTGQIQHAGFMFHKDGTPHLFDRDKYDALDPGDSNRPKFVMGVTGAFQAIRVSALEEIGFYSTKYFMAYEDCEYCLRAWDKNWQVFYDAYIEGVHYEGATRGKGLSKNEMESIEQFKKDFEQIDLNRVHLCIDNAQKELQLQLEGSEGVTS